MDWPELVVQYLPRFISTATRGPSHPLPNLKEISFTAAGYPLGAGRRHSI